MTLPENISRTDIESVIDEWIVGSQAERNRQILKRRLTDGIRFELLAEEFGLSVKQTQRIVYAGCRVIFAHWKG